jgi:hypothetical protein
MKLSETLKRSLIQAAIALAKRPRELRGPFIVNHELVERIARASAGREGPMSLPRFMTDEELRIGEAT